MENITSLRNNTINQTEDGLCITTINRTFTKIGFTVAYCIVFVVAIVGNSFTIYIVRTYKDMPKVPFNYLIINMAVADIIDALIAVPHSTFYLYLGTTWFPGILGVITCKLVIFGVMISVAASVATLMIMAIDRFRAIVCSLRKPLTIREVKISIAFVWIVSGAISGPELYVNTVFLNPLIENNNDLYICTHDGRPGGTWTVENYARRSALINFILLYAIPLLVMVILYSIIMFYMWKRTSPGELSDANQKRMESQKRKVITMLVTIVTVFAVCWMGVHLMSFLLSFSDLLDNCQLPEFLFMFLIWISHANAAINPCIYFIFIRNFRKGLASLFKPRRREGISFASSTRSSQKNTEGVTTQFAFSHHSPASPKLLRVTCEDESGAFKLLPSSCTTKQSMVTSKHDSLEELVSSDKHQSSPPNGKARSNSVDNSNCDANAKKKLISTVM